MSCSTEALELLDVATNAAMDALAEDSVAIDVTQNLPFADCFLIVTADNPRHLRAVKNAIEDALRDDKGIRPLNVEGDETSDWLLLDYGDLVVHIFLPESREFYALEKLWGHSPRVEVLKQGA